MKRQKDVQEILRRNRIGAVDSDGITTAAGYLELNAITVLGGYPATYVFYKSGATYKIATANPQTSVDDTFTPSGVTVISGDTTVTGPFIITGDTSVKVNGIDVTKTTFSGATVTNGQTIEVGDKDYTFLGLAGSLGSVYFYTTDETNIVSITIDSGSTTITSGGTNVQLTGTGVYSDGAEVDITTSISWSSSDIYVATIGEFTGILDPIASGTTMITADYGDVTETIEITVEDE